MLSWEPLLDPIHLALLGGAAVLLCLGFYWRQWASVSAGRAALLTGLRVLGVVLLFGLLFNPVKTREIEEPSQRNFAILLDTSRSMQVRDCAGRPRMEAAGAAFLESRLVERLQEDHRLMLYGLDTTLHPSPDLEVLTNPGLAAGERTALGDGLAAALELARSGEGSVAGMLLMSDGQENAGGEPEQVARRAHALGVPIWTVCVGSDTQARDVAVVPAVNEDYVFVDHTAHIRVDLVQSGFNDARVLLRLRRDDEVVESRPVSFAGIHHQRLSLLVKEAEAGLYRYTVEVEPLEGEAETSNNTRTVFIRAINEKIRVLLVEGAPHWETKFLVAALREDENINVSSLFQLTDRKNFGVVEDMVTDVDRSVDRLELPRTAEEFAEYDAILLGRDTNMSPDVQEALQAYVADGGNLLFARGPVAGPARGGEGPLRKLEPVVWGSGNIGRYRLVPTAEGRASAIFEAPEGTDAEKVFGRLPEMLGAASVRETRAGARALAAAGTPGRGSSPNEPEPMAVIVYQNYGAGRTLLVDAEGLWRWGFLRAELADYDSIYPRFWGQLIRWLVAGGEGLPGEQINFKTERLTYDIGETVTFYVFNNRADREDFDPMIDVTLPSGKTVSMRPLQEADDAAVMLAVLECEEDGQYDAVLRTGLDQPESLEWSFTAYRDSSEDLIVTAQPERMRRIAELSGGEMLTLEELSELPERLAEAEAGRIRRTETDPWWDQGWLLASIVGVFGLEWFLRRRSGLY